MIAVYVTNITAYLGLLLKLPLVSIRAIGLLISRDDSSSPQVLVNQAPLLGKLRVQGNTPDFTLEHFIVLFQPVQVGISSEDYSTMHIQS